MSPTTPFRDHIDRGFAAEQAGVMDRALLAYQAAGDAAASETERAEAHLRLARVHRTLSAWDDALSHSRKAAGLAAEADLPDLRAEALNVEIGVHLLRGDYAAAEGLIERALAIARSARVRGITLQNLGSLLAGRERFAEADRVFGESAEAFREAGYDLGIAIALTNSAEASRQSGNPEAALTIGNRAIAMARSVGALDVLLSAVQNQAHALVELDRLDDAEALVTEALGFFITARNPIRQAESLEILGRLSLRRANQRAMAVRSFRRALDLAQTAGDRLLAERLTRRLAELEESPPETGAGPSSGG